MSDQALGAFAVIEIAAILLLVLTIFAPTIGLFMTSLILSLVGTGLFAAAKSSFHEATAAIFILAAVTSGGMAGLSRQISVKKPRNEDDIYPAVKEYFKNKNREEPIAPSPRQ